MTRGTNLTRKQFDQVIRRATELAVHDSDSMDLSESELFRIARDVGVPERHVRRALSEVRTGAAGGPLDRLFGPEVVAASRSVSGVPTELAGAIDNFLVAGRLLQPLRRGPNVLHYRPAVDWISQVARAASATSRRYYVASAKSVEVYLEEIGTGSGTTLVEFRVDPGTRGDAIGGAIMGGGAGGAAGGAGGAAGGAGGAAGGAGGAAGGAGGAAGGAGGAAGGAGGAAGGAGGAAGGAGGAAGGAGGAAGGAAVGFWLATVAPVAWATLAGVSVAGGVASGIAWAVGRSHQRKVRDVLAEVEGILDQLEAGETLEPPPPSWRQWVRRQFHGARKMLRELDLEEPDFDLGGPR